MRTALTAAEQKSGSARKTALTGLATRLDGDAATAADGAKVRALAAAARDLARN
ncbi:MAG: hypothetical protein ACREMW_06085 [Gemmatimonadales bacterium]